MSGFAFAELGEKVSKSYNNPYDAYLNRNRNSKTKLCLVSDNKVIRILDTKISLKWAVSCAKHVLHIFEEQNPDDKKPRKAIEAASNFIKDPSKTNQAFCKVAFYDIDNDTTHEGWLVANRVANSTEEASCAAFSVYSASKIAVYYPDVYVATAYHPYNDAYYASYYAATAAPNKTLEIKWQRKKLNQIVYEDILILLVKSQYQRIDNKLVRKIPKELLEYIGSFIIG